MLIAKRSTRSRDAYRNTTETFSHGNLTLENILYQPNSNTITLIDPYEENVIDSALADYSQILQSCNSKYEIYNARTPTISGNRITCEIPSYAGLDQFNDRFWTYLRGRFTTDDLKKLAGLNYKGIAELEETVRRLAALRTWGVTNGALRLGITHVALLRWAQRRQLET